MSTRLICRTRKPLVRSSFSRRFPVLASVQRTAFSFETSRITKLICTRQALKTTLNYLSETNGELHFFLHNYVASNPLSLDPKIDADEWLVQLAASPLTSVSDPGRSSVVSAASVAAATKGERQVSPRDVVERIMNLREHIAKEMVEDLSRITADNASVMRMALQKTFTEVRLPDLD